MPSAKVEGKIRFEESAVAFSGAIMYVNVERVTYADAASEIIASYTRQEMSFDPQNTDSDILTFKLEVSDLNPQDDYAIRVHIDLDSDGKISRGDYINMQSYPVLTRGHPVEVSILVRQVP
jgi:Type III secretion system lipoprotein chaperone (YscW)